MEIACITLIVYMCVYRIVNVLIKPFNQCNLACNMFLVHTQCYLVICEHDETFKTPTYCYDLYYYDKIFTYITLGECNKVFFIICWGEIHKTDRYTSWHCSVPFQAKYWALYETVHVWISFIYQTFL